MAKIDEELQKLLDVLPPRVEQTLSKHPEVNSLIEVVLDLGKPPEARFERKMYYIPGDQVSEDDLEHVVEKIGEFTSDNRAGIERTLHRISCMRNRTGKIVGLTCRIGRAVYGTIEIIADFVESGKSILIMGRPGIGKTTMLREAARIPALTHLNQWSETLGPGNWRDAHRAARAAYAAATYARATPHATDIERTLANRAADAATYAADTATYNDPDEIYANAIFAAHSSAAYFDYSTVFSAQKHTKAEIVAMCREWLLNN